MEPQTVRQLRGAIDLIIEVVDANVRDIEEAHQSLARQPYALLAQIKPIAQPVRGIEQVQIMITGGVYGVIRVVNSITGGVATSVLDRFEE